MRIYYIFCPKPNVTASLVHFFDLTQDQQFVIGRSRGVDLQVSDNICSRRHALFMLSESGELYLRDLKSRNGTFLAKEKIKQVKVEEGSKIKFGETQIQIIKILDSGLSKGPEKLKEFDEDQHTIDTQEAIIPAGNWSHYFECLPGVQKIKFKTYAP